MLADKMNGEADFAKPFIPPNDELNRKYDLHSRIERDIGKTDDWSPLYTYIKFDGENYIFTGYGEEENLNEVIGKAPSFELGCIFEIGRILHENNIKFKGISTIKKHT